MNMSLAAHSLILSSSSPARRSLLSRLQLPFLSVSPHVDETPHLNEEAKALVERLAELKATMTKTAYPTSVIIGCDQVGTLEDAILMKPLTYENAYAQLSKMSEKKVRFFTGICVLDAEKNSVQKAVEIYDVYFRKLSPTMIHCYLEKEKPFECAGSFQAEGLGITLIHKFSGDDFTALIGLPLIRLTAMLEKTGRKELQPLGM